MSNDYSPRSGGGQRRGRRRSGASGRSSGGSGRGSSDSRTERFNRPDKKKQTFSQKISTFFKKLFGSKKPTVSSSSSRGSGSGSVSRAKTSHQDSAAASSTTRPQTSGPKTELEAPNPDLVTTPRLYVGNLSYDTAESDLFDLFSKVGSVRNVELVMDRRANRSKGFGFVEMNDIDVAKQAVMKIHRMDFMGRQIVVSGAKSDRRETETPHSTSSHPENGEGSPAH